MVNFTFFEIHLHDASFEANAPFSGSSDDESTEEDETDFDIDVDAGELDGGPPKAVPLVLGLVFLVGVAAIVRKLRGGGDDEEPVIEDVGEPVEA